MVPIPDFDSKIDASTTASPPVELYTNPDTEINWALLLNGRTAMINKKNVIIVLMATEKYMMMKF